MKEHLSADDLYYLSAEQDQPEIRFNIEDVDEDIDNIRRISEVEMELDEMSISAVACKYEKCFFSDLVHMDSPFWACRILNYIWVQGFKGYRVRRVQDSASYP